MMPCSGSPRRLSNSHEPARMSSVTPVPPAGPAEAAVGATILVVDDSPVNLRLVVRTLEGRGYRLLAAKNGRAALDIARRVHPDLIRSRRDDARTRRLRGLSRAQSDPSTRDAIVVFLSQLWEKCTRQGVPRGSSSGRPTDITKPFNPRKSSRASPTTSRASSWSARFVAAAIAWSGNSRAPARCSAASSPPRCRQGWAAMFAAYYRTNLYAGGNYYVSVASPGDGQFGVIVATVGDTARPRPS